MDQVEEIKQRLDVAEVIGGYLQLKQAGRNLKAPCPFHQEKTASFMVSPEKNIWHCFGCQEGGDVITFVMKMEGLDFREALELLARRAGIELKPLRGANSSDSKLKERLYLAHRWAVRYYQASLGRNSRALEYIVRGRHLTKETLIDFSIGYAPESWEGLSKFLQKKGFTGEELIKAGLAGKKTGLYDLFRGRIMLPISDNQGRPIGFTGRVLNDGVPKYLNSPQTALYDKSRAIYGLHLAKNAIRETDEVVLVEGNLDVLASHQAGVKQVVAASGTALTLDQLRTLSRLTKNIKLAFDQDAAGLAATERAIELGQKLGVTLSMIEVPGAKDPDELIQKSPELWVKAIKEAKYIIDYLFDHFETQFDLSTAMGKRQFSDRLAQNLKRLGDPVEQDHYVQLLAKKTGVSPDAITKKLDQTVEAPPVYARPKEAEPLRTLADNPPASPRALIEEAVLAINLAWPDVRVSLEDLSPDDFEDPDRRLIFAAITKSKLSGLDVAKSLSNQADYVKILTLRGEEEFTSLSPAVRGPEAFGLARRLQIYSNKNIMSKLQSQLREAEKRGDAQLVRRLLQEYQTLSSEEV